MTGVRVRALLVFVVVLMLGMVAGAEGAAAADTRHHGRYWVWFGPRTWDASYGTYGITVSSPSGRDVLDLGFGTTVCASGASYSASAKNYFAAKRKQYNRGAFRILKTGKITHPAGTDTLYRRQALRLRIRSGGVTYAGAFTFDYDFTQNVPSGGGSVNYCYQRSLGLYAPASRFDKTSRPVLGRIFKSLAYSGPGACLGKSGSCDPDIG